jgi:hypothetical protein
MAVVLLGMVGLVCGGWKGFEEREGGLRVLIEKVEPVRARAQAVPCRVQIENQGQESLSGTVSLFGLVDSHGVGKTQQDFRLEPGAKSALDFQIEFESQALAALYPVHVMVEFTAQGQKRSVHVVRIVETVFEKTKKVGESAATLEPQAVPEEGALAFCSLPGRQRGGWNYYDGPVQFKPVGWSGSDDVSRATLNFTEVVRGTHKPAILMHPAWEGGGGPVFCDYLVRLPAVQDGKPGARLLFSNAIRDSSEKEGKSDGVLFRVWVGDPEGKNMKTLYEKFTDSKVWVDGSVDLSAYAGQTILVRLESHPGPNRNTSCDACYWGEPVVVAGEGGPSDLFKKETFEAVCQRNLTRGRALLDEREKPDGKTAFLMREGGERFALVLEPSKRGMVDGIVSLVGPKAVVNFKGFQVDALDVPVLRWPSRVGVKGFEVVSGGDRVRYVHHLELDGKPFDLTLSFRSEGAGVRVAWTSTEHLTLFSLGPSDRRAPSVYFGHGYRIEEPEAFQAVMDGHNLSTSHIGCDFEGGLSLLQALDVPPKSFQVEPAEPRYALRGSGKEGTLTLVPGEAGALDCAVRYRPLYDKKPSAAVGRLAGRFCFDIWGGAYSEIAERMREAIRYGLTDSFLTIHDWQRWGYDYRLPDIWPPEPSKGTVEDMRKIGEVCWAQDIPWGLHDNYIDFYPDAEGYSYDSIMFWREGTPVKAWLNEGIPDGGAQSYRWRPDAFMPVLQRNLKLVKEGVVPTHYFMDVFSSIGYFDFYDRSGQFHPATETRQKWGEAFAWIRNYLGGDAPTTSEAGNDQLIGYLDGADCQFLMLSPDSKPFALQIRCKDWERVPWYDAVNHSRFILHGVGYSSRYQSDRSRAEHGIMSDDYISAEILTGHALMVDAEAWGRQAVRKYWLAQAVARNLAQREIVRVEFGKGDDGKPDIHRQCVVWDNGMKAYVNRGTNDWNLEDRSQTLPPFGFLVEGKSFQAGVLREADQKTLQEYAIDKETTYFNARMFDPALPFPIRPRIENFRQVGERQIEYDLVWETGAATREPMTVFGHFYGTKSSREDKIAFQDDYRPEPATTAWTGTVRSHRAVTLPQDAEGVYQLGYGMYKPGGPRLDLRGPQVPGIRSGASWVGTLNVTRQAGKITEIGLTIPEELKNLPSLPVLNSTAFSTFGFQFEGCRGRVLTKGAFRLLKQEGKLRLIPLPESPEFETRLSLERPAGSPEGGTRIPIKRVVAFDREGHELPAPAWREEKGEGVLRHDGRAFCYDLILE